ncbi:MAG: glycosyltransferase [Cyanobacteria bacterium J06560_6]
MTQTITLGYLNIGPPRHGILKYGKNIEKMAQAHNAVEVISARVNLDGTVEENKQRLLEAATCLQQADIVHLQHNHALWGGQQQADYFEFFTNSCDRPILATLHDVYLNTDAFNGRNLVTYLKQHYGRRSQFYRRLFKSCAGVVVCTHQESKQLTTVVCKRRKTREKLQTIPHYVETRATTYAKAQPANPPKEKDTRQQLTLLGWIHPRKGHRLMVEALAKLPENVDLTFAGQASPENEPFLTDLLALTETLGIRQRVHLTGYLSETQLEDHLLRADIAVCPFEDVSASGSLSTWISIAHPAIVATSLDSIEEYNQLVKGAIVTFTPYTAAALASTLRQMLSTDLFARNDQVQSLRQQLLLPKIFELHLDLYRQLFRDER